MLLPALESLFLSKGQENQRTTRSKVLGKKEEHLKCPISEKPVSVCASVILFANCVKKT